MTLLHPEFCSHVISWHRDKWTYIRMYKRIDVQPVNVSLPSSHVTVLDVGIHYQHHIWLMSTNHLFCSVMVAFWQSGSFTDEAQRWWILKPRPLHHSVWHTPAHDHCAIWCDVHQIVIVHCTIQCITSACRCPLHHLVLRTSACHCLQHMTYISSSSFTAPCDA